MLRVKWDCHINKNILRNSINTISKAMYIFCIPYHLLYNLPVKINSCKLIASITRQKIAHTFFFVSATILLKTHSFKFQLLCNAK